MVGKVLKISLAAVLLWAAFFWVQHLIRSSHPASSKKIFDHNKAKRGVSARRRPYKRAPQKRYHIFPLSGASALPRDTSSVSKHALKNAPHPAMAQPFEEPTLWLTRASAAQPIEKEDKPLHHALRHDLVIVPRKHAEPVWAYEKGQGKDPEERASEGFGGATPTTSASASNTPAPSARTSPVTSARTSPVTSPRTSPVTSPRASVPTPQPVDQSLAQPIAQPASAATVASPATTTITPVVTSAEVSDTERLSQASSPVMPHTSPIPSSPIETGNVGKPQSARPDVTSQDVTRNDVPSAGRTPATTSSTTLSSSSSTPRSAATMASPQRSHYRSPVRSFPLQRSLRTVSGSPGKASAGAAKNPLRETPPASSGIPDRSVSTAATSTTEKPSPRSQSKPLPCIVPQALWPFDIPSPVNAASQTSPANASPAESPAIAPPPVPRRTSLTTPPARSPAASATSQSNAHKATPSTLSSDALPGSTPPATQRTTSPDTAPETTQNTTQSTLPRSPLGQNTTVSSAFESEEAHQFSADFPPLSSSAGDSENSDSEPEVLSNCSSPTSLIEVSSDSSLESSDASDTSAYAGHAHVSSHASSHTFSRTDSETSSPDVVSATIPNVTADDLPGTVQSDYYDTTTDFYSPSAASSEAGVSRESSPATSSTQVSLSPQPSDTVYEESIDILLAPQSPLTAASPQTKPAMVARPKTVQQQASLAVKPAQEKTFPQALATVATKMATKMASDVASALLPIPQTPAKRFKANVATPNLSPFSREVRRAGRKDHVVEMDSLSNMSFDLGPTPEKTPQSVVVVAPSPKLGTDDAGLDTLLSASPKLKADGTEIPSLSPFSLGNARGTTLETPAFSSLDEAQNHSVLSSVRPVGGGRDDDTKPVEQIASQSFMAQGMEQKPASASGFLDNTGGGASFVGSSFNESRGYVFADISGNSANVSDVAAEARSDAHRKARDVLPGKTQDVNLILPTSSVQQAAYAEQTGHKTKQNTAQKPVSASEFLDCEGISLKEARDHLFLGVCDVQTPSEQASQKQPLTPLSRGLIDSTNAQPRSARAARRTPKTRYAHRRTRSDGDKLGKSPLIRALFKVPDVNGSDASGITSSTSQSTYLVHGESATKKSIVQSLALSAQKKHAEVKEKDVGTLPVLSASFALENAVPQTEQKAGQKPKSASGFLNATGESVARSHFVDSPGYMFANVSEELGSSASPGYIFANVSEDIENVSSVQSSKPQKLSASISGLDLANVSDEKLSASGYLENLEGLSLANISKEHLWASGGEESLGLANISAGSNTTGVKSANQSFNLTPRRKHMMDAPDLFYRGNKKQKAAYLKECKNLGIIAQQNGDDWDFFIPQQVHRDAFLAAAPQRLREIGRSRKKQNAFCDEARVLGLQVVKEGGGIYVVEPDISHTQAGVLFSPKRKISGEKAESAQATSLMTKGQPALKANQKTDQKTAEVTDPMVNSAKTQEKAQTGMKAETRTTPQRMLSPLNPNRVPQSRMANISQRAQASPLAMRLGASYASPKTPAQKQATLLMGTPSTVQQFSKTKGKFSPKTLQQMRAAKLGEIAGKIRRADPEQLAVLKKEARRFGLRVTRERSVVVLPADISHRSAGDLAVASPKKKDENTVISEGLANKRFGGRVATGDDKEDVAAQKARSDGGNIKSVTGVNVNAASATLAKGQASNNDQPTKSSKVFWHTALRGALWGQEKAQNNNEKAGDKKPQNSEGANKTATNNEEVQDTQALASESAVATTLVSTNKDSAANSTQTGLNAGSAPVVAPMVAPADAPASLVVSAVSTSAPVLVPAVSPTKSYAAAASTPPSKKGAQNVKHGPEHRLHGSQQGMGCGSEKVSHEAPHATSQKMPVSPAQSLYSHVSLFSITPEDRRPRKSTPAPEAQPPTKQHNTADVSVALLASPAISPVADASINTSFNTVAVNIAAVNSSIKAPADRSTHNNPAATASPLASRKTTPASGKTPDVRLEASYQGSTSLRDNMRAQQTPEHPSRKSLKPLQTSRNADISSQNTSLQNTSAQRVPAPRPRFKRQNIWGAQPLASKALLGELNARQKRKNNARKVNASDAVKNNVDQKTHTGLEAPSATVTATASLPATPTAKSYARAAKTPPSRKGLQNIKYGPEKDVLEKTAEATEIAPGRVPPSLRTGKGINLSHMQGNVTGKNSADRTLKTQAAQASNGTISHKRAVNRAISLARDRGTGRVSDSLRGDARRAAVRDRFRAIVGRVIMENRARRGSMRDADRSDQGSTSVSTGGWRSRPSRGDE